MEIFSKTEGSTFYFQSPLPYLCTCTITVDAKRKDPVEERKSERQWNDKFLWSFWVTRLSHTYFWEMDTTSSCKCFGKMEIVYVGTCKTKLYGKSRNGVSFNRLACNRQKETLFLMPYYWDMKGWRATVSCRLDCAIKMELRVVAIKVSRCQHGKQRKVLGCIVLKYFKAYRQGFFLPCHSRRKLVWGTRTVFLRRRLTFIQNTRKDENMQTK